VAARGLDLPDLGLVIHADLPVNKATLLHRSGRTGRAGRKGVSVLLVSHTRRRKAEQLLASAHIDAGWSGPPTPEEIRAQDQTRLLSDPVLTEPVAEDELELARLLLADRTPEEVAAALVRLHRARLPAAEELFDDVRMREAQADGRVRPPREEVGRGERLDPAACVWFRITVGRSNSADPKWLIPMICRLGHVTKQDIGQIRIFDRETKFEISREAEARFAAAVKATANEDIRIEPAAAPGEKSAGPRKGPPHRKGKPPVRKGPPGGRKANAAHGR
jgi:ATP-dependent RNA helicase DeaD